MCVCVCVCVCVLRRFPVRNASGHPGKDAFFSKNPVTRNKTDGESISEYAHDPYKRISTVEIYNLV